jgi:hypothetical protein
MLEDYTETNPVGEAFRRSTRRIGVNAPSLGVSILAPRPVSLSPWKVTGP